MQIYGFITPWRQRTLLVNNRILLVCRMGVYNLGGNSLGGNSIVLEIGFTRSYNAKFEKLLMAVFNEMDPTLENIYICCSKFGNRAL